MQLSEYIRDLVNLLAAHGDLKVVRQIGDNEFDDLVNGPEVQALRFKGEDSTLVNQAYVDEVAASDPEDPRRFERLASNAHDRVVL